MADWIDISVNQQEATLHAQRQERRPEGPAATGFCLFCDTALPEHMRWCDSECRDKWESERRVRGGGR